MYSTLRFFLGEGGLHTLLPPSPPPPVLLSFQCSSRTLPPSHLYACLPAHFKLGGTPTFQHPSTPAQSFRSLPSHPSVCVNIYIPLQIQIYIYIHFHLPPPPPVSTQTSCCLLLSPFSFFLFLSAFYSTDCVAIVSHIFRLFSFLLLFIVSHVPPPPPPHTPLLQQLDNTEQQNAKSKHGEPQLYMPFSSIITGLCNTHAASSSVLSPFSSHPANVFNLTCIQSLSLSISGRRGAGRGSSAKHALQKKLRDTSSQPIKHDISISNDNNPTLDRGGTEEESNESIATASRHTVLRAHPRLLHRRQRRFSNRLYPILVIVVGIAAVSSLGRLASAVVSSCCRGWQSAPALTGR